MNEKEMMEEAYFELLKRAREEIGEEYDELLKEAEVEYSRLWRGELEKEWGPLTWE